ncbi:MAG: histidine kinase, partial [Massilibacteroides sp.]|nr:histidine kinase [Massilibacteroides sp.]
SILMRSYTMLFNVQSQNNPETSFETFFLFFSLAWFFLFSFLLFILYEQLYALAVRLFKEKEFKSFFFATILCLGFAYGLFQLYPALHRTVMVDVLEIRPPNGEKSLFLYDDHKEIPPGRIPKMKAPPWDRERMLIRPIPLFRPLFTEHLFVLLTVMLCVILLRQLRSKQEMMLAYEKLKSEKFKSSYNALMGQINPHFFFNSLNGLNALIRSGEKEQTLQYLDELSNVFRYILQSNHKELVSLSEELQFVKAYTYLLEVRYEGKLFFSIQTDPAYLFWHLPILSILPLIENAVKHNVISRQYPLQIDIYTTTEDELVVSNKIQQKVEDSKGSGIGLKNLWERYKMLTGKDIYISAQREYFKVRLPLIKNKEK